MPVRHTLAALGLIAGAMTATPAFAGEGEDHFEHRALPPIPEGPEYGPEEAVGYGEEEREAWLKDNGFRNQIQRKGKRNKPCPVASSAQQTHRHDTRAGRTCVRSHRAYGRQAAAHDRSGAGKLCDDDDGGVLLRRAQELGAVARP